MSAPALTAERTRIEAAVSISPTPNRRVIPTVNCRRDWCSPPIRTNTFEQALGQASAVGVVAAGRSDAQSAADPSHRRGCRRLRSLPNIDTPEEMVNMLSASRAYQANLTAIGLIRELVQKSLELGK